MVEPRQAVIMRFAPSPTGRLHLGHAFSAMLSHDLARSRAGWFVLRIEDIDSARCRPDFVDAIVEDLRWLGIDWDALDIQTHHARQHATMLDQLRDLGLIYPCICNRSEIAASASAPHGNAGSVYPGTCRERVMAAQETRPTAWRLDVGKAVALTGSLSWYDADAGTVAADPLAGGDVVVARKGSGATYHLAAVADDATAGVTHVVRGVDLFAATHVQRLLQALLDLPVPRYRHHRLIAGPDGKRLAKRTPGSTLADLRKAGVDPAVLCDDLRKHRLPVGFGWVHA